MYHSQRTQRGNLFVVVIFVIVVMGFLAASLSRVEWSNQEANSRDVLGSQAWLLAHSVNEWALTQLYPPLNTGEQFDLTATCSALPAVPAGLYTENCRQIVVSCTPPGSGIPEALRYFTLQSRVQCGSGEFLVERSQQAWLREVE
ncbi:MSHA biogenesis protein MshP [Vibrio sp.]|uniref:MSHA biogenesis protein MshP n=1 Tax=Vibrio sp. TaxID=678 RepID=UPI003D110086